MGYGWIRIYVNLGVVLRAADARCLVDHDPDPFVNEGIVLGAAKEWRTLSRSFTNQGVVFGAANAPCPVPSPTKVLGSKGVCVGWDVHFTR